MNDYYIYYDFSKEIILQDWRIAELSTGKYLLSAQFDADADAAILAFQLRPQEAPTYCRILAFELKGNNMRWDQNAPALYHPVAGCTCPAKQQADKGFGRKRISAASSIPGFRWDI